MNRHVRHNSPLEAVLAVIYYELSGVMKERTDSQQGLEKYSLRFSSDNHLKHILTYVRHILSKVSPQKNIPLILLPIPCFWYTVLNLLTNWLRLLADFMTEPSRAISATSLHCV